jgi:hypothetical protein
MRPSPICVVPILIFGLLASSCAYQGRTIDQTKVPLVQPGQTNRAQIEGSFGPPDIENSVGDHKSLLYNHMYIQLNIWSYLPIIQFIIGGYDEQHQALQVIIDKNDLVESINFKQYAGSSTIWHRHLDEQPTTEQSP